ncbi:MAG: peptide-methionine (R)-S-oxide reductase MsrB [Parvibaculum sp.]
MMSRRMFLGSTALAGVLAAAGVALRGGNGNASETNSFEVTKTDAEWKAALTPEQYYVLRDHGTERPGSSPLDKEKRQGTFHCAACELPLFASATKYDSGTGWPSFYAPLENAVGTSEDRAFFMTRTEVHCRRCGGHLGHVFDDGPPPTGKRYCMNGVAMSFKASGAA